MKVTLKELNGTTWQLDISEDSQVADLKNEIMREKAHPLEHQKLIYQGKILGDDSATLQSCGLEEGKFIVVMVSRPKEAAAKPAQSPAAHITATPQQPTTAQQPPAAPAPQPRTQAPSILETQALPEPDPMTESLINQLMEMGFSRDQCEPALRAAFGNPDRAVEYLMSGIPENLRDVAANPTPLRRAAPVPTQEPAPVTPSRPVTSAATSTASQSGPLSFLVDTEEFMQMRAIAQTNPAALAPLLTELGRQNPAILQAFNSNKEELLRLLNDREATRRVLSRGPPRGTAIQVTPEEKEAIDRLCALGFDRQLVIEAYLACDKNETLAANYLFDSSNFE